MWNGDHRESERDRIADRGAGRRRVARVKEVSKDTGLRLGAGDRRLVVVGVPAALGLLEAEQRLANGIVDERAAERGRDQVTGTAGDDLPDPPAAVLAAVVGIDPHGELLPVAGDGQRGLRGVRRSGETGEPGTGGDGESGDCRRRSGSTVHWCSLPVNRSKAAATASARLQAIYRRPDRAGWHARRRVTGDGDCPLRGRDGERDQTVGG